MNLLEKGFFYYKNGNYDLAYYCYSRLKEIYRTSAFDFNISLSKKKLTNTDISLIDIFSIYDIECIYVLNLERRIDRRLKLKREFNKLGINFKIVKAVDALIDNDVKRRFEAFEKKKEINHEYLSHLPLWKVKMMREQITLGAFGYNLSQKKVFKDALSKGFKKILIFDDDVFFTEDFLERIVETLEKLSNNYKVLMLGASEYKYQDDESFQATIKDKKTYIPFPGRTLGSFSAVYDSSIFNEIIKIIDCNLGTFDNVVLGRLFHKYKNCYVINPNICIPSIEDSDIRSNKRFQVEHAKKMRWDVGRFKEWNEKPTYSFLLKTIDQIIALKKLTYSFHEMARVSFYYLSNKDGLRCLVAGRDMEDINFLKSDISEICNVDEIKNCPHTDFLIKLDEKFILNKNNIIKVLEGVYDKTFSEEVEVFSNFGLNPIDNLVSIIIPVFREVEKIWPSVKSALTQTSDKYSFEVIVVNDNPSNLNFNNDLRSVFNNSKIKSKLRIISHLKNRGASAARNTGILASQGSYISFLDDDDIYFPLKSHELVEVLVSSDDSVGGAYCGFIGGAHDKENKDRYIKGNLFNEIIGIDYKKHYINTNTVIYKRKSVLNLNGFNESYRRHQDIEFNSRFFLLYDIDFSSFFGVQIRPQQQVKTFHANFQNIYNLKIKLLGDFKDDILRLDEKFIEEIVYSHTMDIYKRKSKGDLISYDEIYKVLMDVLKK